MGLSQYYTPTRVTFGQGAWKEVASQVRAQGAQKVLVHYGSCRIVDSGFLKSVTDILEEAGIGHIELGGVVPNPRLSLVRQGIELCRKEGVDLILAIGGGSVIDSAKCMGYGVVYDGDVWDFYCQKARPQASLPVGCILTMAAAGSEMSDSSVITNEEGLLKRGCNSDVCRLRFALMDPTLTYSLPARQTAAAIVDIMMHTMERFFTGQGSMPLTDELALRLLSTVMDAGRKALECPDDYNARASLMWASSLSHNGLMALGNGTKGDWACHQLEHELSGMYDVAHGAGLAALWPSWARYNLFVRPERIAQLGKALFGIGTSGDSIHDAEATITAMEDFYASIGMPTRISGLGVKLSDEDIAVLADKCSFGSSRTIGDFRKLGRDDMAAIYSMAR